MRRFQPIRPQCSALCCLIAVLLLAPTLHATIIVSDNFDSGISGWTLAGTGSGATILAEARESAFTNHVSGQSANIVDASTSTAPALQRNFTLTGGDLSKVLSIEFDYLYDATNTNPAFQLTDGVTNNGMKMHLTTAGTSFAQWRSSSGFNNLSDSPLSSGTWYHFRLLVQPASSSPDKWALFISDTTGALNNGYANLTFQSELTTFSRISFYNNTAGSATGGDFNIDNVLVQTIDAAAQILVRGGSPLTSIADGDNSASLTDGSDFGTLNVGDVIAHTFNVRNDGAANLTLGSLSLPTGFTLNAGFGLTTLAPGESTTFIVGVNTAVAGIYAGDVSFTTNDATATTYNFALHAVVVPAPAAIEAGFALLGVMLIRRRR